MEEEVAKTKRNSFKLINEKINRFTDDEQLRNLLKEWIKIRKAKHAANTEYAIELNLDKLYGFAHLSGMAPDEYLKEVIRRGWIAFYVIKNYSGETTQSVMNEDY